MACDNDLLSTPYYFSLLKNCCDSFKFPEKNRPKSDPFPALIKTEVASENYGFDFNSVTIVVLMIFSQETGNAYCETTDKDSSDEQSTTSNISTKIKSRGLHEKGFVYYLVKQDTWEHCWVRDGDNCVETIKLNQISAGQSNSVPSQGRM